jgi:hypothetical protein
MLIGFVHRATNLTLEPTRIFSHVPTNYTTDGVGFAPMPQKESIRPQTQWKRQSFRYAGFQSTYRNNKNLQFVSDSLAYRFFIPPFQFTRQISAHFCALN